MERHHREVVGQCIFTIFPGHHEPSGEGPQRLRESLESVCETGEMDWVHMLRYDHERADEPGIFEERYWNVVSAPVLGADGKPVAIIHLIEDATPQVRAARTDHAVAG
jgi:hypothetical protein